MITDFPLDINDVRNKTGHSISSIRKYARENPQFAVRIGRSYRFNPGILAIIKSKIKPPKSGILYISNGNADECPDQPTCVHEQLVVNWDRI